MFALAKKSVNVFSGSEHYVDNAAPGGTLLSERNTDLQGWKPDFILKKRSWVRCEYSFNMKQKPTDGLVTFLTVVLTASL